MNQADQREYMEAREKALEMNRRQRLFIATVALIVSLITAIGLVSTLYRTWEGNTDSKNENIDLGRERDRLQRQVAQLKSELAKLKIDVLKARQIQVSPVDPNYPADSAKNLASRIAGNEIELKEISARLDVLEDALESDPEKALSLPLMRKDLTTHSQQAEKDNSAIRSDVDRLESTVYSLSATIITSLLVIAGACVALIFRYVLPNKKGKEI